MDIEKARDLENKDFTRRTYRDVGDLRREIRDYQTLIEKQMVLLEKHSRGTAYALLCSYMILEKLAVLDNITAFFKYWMVKI